MQTRQARFGGQYFYLGMSLVITAIVIYGFSHTVNGNLFHPVHPSLARPWILWLHGSLFFGWLLFFILQSILVRTHNVRVHRTLGWFGVAMGIAIVIVGTGTAITMTRYNILHQRFSDATQFLAIPLSDMAIFAILFSLAIYWRKKPEYHRRLMLITCCCLTDAGFGRFPFSAFSDHWFYAGVDFLLVMAIARDLLVTRTVHPVYRYAVPALVAVQIITMYAYLAAPPRWMEMANAILR
ncbi:MAG TPA: hypothetical protein VKW78_07740 [Terriglobales bacterium]|nr:hypothetical protein [Terriglobales bacterium]